MKQLLLCYVFFSLTSNYGGATDWHTLTHSRKHTHTHTHTYTTRTHTHTHTTNIAKQDAKHAIMYTHVAHVIITSYAAMTHVIDHVYITCHDVINKLFMIASHIWSPCSNYAMAHNLQNLFESRPNVSCFKVICVTWSKPWSKSITNSTAANRSANSCCPTLITRYTRKRCAWRLQSWNLNLQLYNVPCE